MVSTHTQNKPHHQSVPLIFFHYLLVDNNFPDLQIKLYSLKNILFNSKAALNKDLYTGFKKMLSKS